MKTLHWQDIPARTPHGQGSAGDRWFGTAMLLTGIIIGYLIAVASVSL